MSIEHFKAAFKCKKFSGNARLLLLALADRAANHKNRKFKFGWCNPGTAQLMMDTAIKSRDTVSDNMKELTDAKVIWRRRRMGTSTLTFVDIKKLEQLTYSEEDKQEFKRRAQSSGSKASSPEEGEWEEFLHSNAGNIPAAEAGESPAKEDGKLSACTARDFPADNPKSNPLVRKSQAVEPSDSESEPDSDSDVPEQPWDDYFEGIPSGEESQEPSFDSDKREPFADSGRDVPPVNSKPALRSSELEFSSATDVAPPTALPDGPERDPQEYADAVHLCSLWWSTHEEPEEVEDTPSPDPVSHPWGHPRTWTPAQRREAFLTVVVKNRHKSDDSSDPSRWEPEPEAEPCPEEDPLLKDEGHMLALLFEHGRDELERVLRWIPKSDYWYSNPKTRLTSLAQLRQKRIWEMVSGQCESYYAKALENGSEARCEAYVEEVFLNAGGGLAEDICYYRLNPIDPNDAAEEEAMDAYDDEHGVTVPNPWAQADYEAAMEALEDKNAGRWWYDEDALYNLNWAGHNAGLLHAFDCVDESEYSDSNEPMSGAEGNSQ